MRFGIEYVHPEAVRQAQHEPVVFGNGRFQNTAGSRDPQPLKKGLTNGFALSPSMRKHCHVRVPDPLIFGSEDKHTESRLLVQRQDIPEALVFRHSEVFARRITIRNKRGPVNLGMRDDRAHQLVIEGALEPYDQEPADTDIEPDATAPKVADFAPRLIVTCCAQGRNASCAMSVQGSGH